MGSDNSNLGRCGATSAGLGSGGPGPANSCFVCGPDNPIGLHLHFRLDDDGRRVADFSPTKDHVGYPGVVHGGIIYSALDDSMANWLYLRGARAYTAKSSVRATGLRWPREKPCAWRAAQSAAGAGSSRWRGWPRGRRTES